MNPDLPTYRVELTEAAEAEVDSAYLYRLRYSPESAHQWHTEFLRAISSLEQLPHRFPPVESQVPDFSIRRMMIGRGGSQCHAVFRIIEPQNGEEGIVRILHVRSAFLPE